MQRITIIGLGYIGLPTAALLANRGYQVHGVDIDLKAVDTINQGKIHIVEPDLDTFVHSAVASGKLRAALTPAEADVFMLCVPTPLHNGSEIPTPNIDYVLEATRAAAPFLRPGNLLILESTSPVGTTEQVAAELRRAGVDPDQLSIAYCPERVLPGRIMIELIENDRVVGGVTPEAGERVAAFYRSFVQGEVLVSDSRTAEMCKLVENSYRDTNIAFANELSMLCGDLNINVWELIRLANRHPRVNILQPGVGVGGHCIAVDPWFIVSSNPEKARLIRTAREVNNDKSLWVIEEVERTLAAIASASGKERPVVAAMGLAFKPDIDDLRESPALAIARQLTSRGHSLVAVEPNVEPGSVEDLELLPVDEALNRADLILFLVRHRPFLLLDTRGKTELDFCGVRA